MKIAVIDCGTNTFNLLVAEASPEKWHVLFQNKLPVKLGAGGFEENTILPARFVRGLDAMLCHKENIRNYSCEKTFAFATSAIREANNGTDFVAKVKSMFQINIEVIDGNREAELIYDGVKQSMSLGKEACLIMDIGGGSTEFIIANDDEIFWKKSFLLGVSRLNDLVKPDDQFTEIDTKYLERILYQELAPLAEALKKFPVTKLIGSSGSFDTILMMHLHKLKREENVIGLHNDIPIKSFHDIHNWLAQSTLDDRVKHRVIPSIRAEYMPLASSLVKHVLSIHKFEHMIHSAYSLKEGAMMDILKRIDWPLTTPKDDEKPEDFLEE